MSDPPSWKDGKRKPLTGAWIVHFFSIVLKEVSSLEYTSPSPARSTGQIQQIVNRYTFSESSKTVPSEAFAGRLQIPDPRRITNWSPSQV